MSTFDDLETLLNESKDVIINDNFDPIKDGTYNAVIESVGFTESKSKKLMFKWEVIISDKPYVGRHEWKYNILNSPENMKRFVTDLNKFGIPTTTMDEINSHLKDLLDVKIILEIKSTPSKEAGKDPYRNLSIKPLK